MPTWSTVPTVRRLRAATLSATALLVSTALLTGTALAGPASAAKPVLTVTDLGTLGGESSQANGINAGGRVVGWAHTSAGDRHAFLAVRGQMRDLGTLGGSTSEAMAINDAGQVTGWSSTGPGGNDPNRAWVWRNGVMTDLGTPAEAAVSVPIDINARGQILGTYWIGYTAHPFLWDRGVVTEITGMAGGFQLTDRGAVLGGIPGWLPQPVLWRHGATTLFPPPVPGEDISPAVINERGRVAGSSATPDSAGVKHALVWSRDHWVDLGGLGGDALVSNINERGTIVGRSATDPEQPWNSFTDRAFVVRGGSVHRLPVLNSAIEYSRAELVNNREQIVGTTSEAERGVAAVLWQKGRIFRLPALHPGTAEQDSPVALNEHGQIAGNARSPEDQRHAVLWQVGRG